MNHQAAIDHILSRLKSELPAHLYYHGPHHTLDVLAASERIGKLHGLSESDRQLLSVAAAYHDCGFLVTYAGHEAEGCNIARKTLPDFDFSETEIETVCEMIMATRVPQEPGSLLAEILCDADLDYLGRDDFYMTGQQLFKEWKVVGIAKDEQTWNRIQVKFLNAHHYHTPFSRKERTPAKLSHLKELEELVASY
ncbi:MAG: HD domain-containing protein [Flavobacteriales bacterium]|nr:HD domain-containing protein [Flavobacteriales bacterium]